MATGNVDAKLLKQTKFPPEFNQKVDMTKVNLEVMKKWIAEKISDILGNEDDVVTELCFNLLEASRYPDIKEIQISLTGFLDKHTASFCKELWGLCLSAQANPQHVPKELLEAKKLELIKEKIDAEAAAEEARRRQVQERAREQDAERSRQRDRGERRERTDYQQRGASGRGFDRRRGPVLRSPPPRRWRSPERDDRRAPPARRDADIYIPADGRESRYRDHDRRPARSPSASRSDPPHRSGSDSPRVGAGDGRRFDDPKPRAPRSFHARYRSRSPHERYGCYEERGRGDRGHRDRGRGDRRQRSTPRYPSCSPSPRRSRRRHTPSPSPSSSTSQTTSASRSLVHGSDPYHRRRQRDVSWSPSPPPRRRSVDARHRRGGGDATTRNAPSYDNHYRESGRFDRREHRYYTDRRRRSPVRDSRRRNGRSVTRSQSPASKRATKRHRSIARYEPIGKRRRNSSSVSPIAEKRYKAADSSEEKGDATSPVRVREGSREKNNRAGRFENNDGIDNNKEESNNNSTKTATEIREVLLRQKIQSMRRTSTDTSQEKAR